MPHLSPARLLAAVAVALSALVLAGAAGADQPPLLVFAPTFPEYAGRIPVLNYHAIGSSPDGLSITRQQFAAQLDMLEANGFHTVSARQFDAFLRGDSSTLPSRPILLTFDDGRADSYAGADPVLVSHAFQATMFVIAGFVGTTARYLDWPAIAAMQQSGRWQVEEHAGYGHVAIPVSDSATGPYYANRRFAAGALESLDAYRARVTRDVEWGYRQIAAHLPGWQGTLFAVPYGNFGQDRSNDPALAQVFGDYLRGRFDAVFVQDHVQAALPGVHAVVQRIAVHTTTTPAALYALLLQAVTAPAGGPPPVPATPVGG